MTSLEEKATELRKRISIAKPEWERLRGNKKSHQEGNEKSGSLVGRV